MPGSAIHIRIFAWDDDAGGYPVEARLSDGSEFPGELLRLELERLLLAENEIDPVKYGMQLFDTLFAGKVGRAYAKIAGKAEAESAGRLQVRLQIDPAAAELHAVPWERIYHYRAGKELALAATALTPFSRFVSLEQAAPAPVDAPRLNLLFAVANPTGMRVTQLLLEVEAVLAAADVRNLADAAKAAAKLAEIDRQLSTLTGNGRVERARSYLKDQLKKLKLASIEAV